LSWAFFQDRLHLDVSAYNTNSTNQIIPVQVSSSTGYGYKIINGGRINNKGLEVQLGINPIKSKGFTWDITTNYSLNRSKVASLDADGRLQSLVLGTDRTVQVLASLGQPYGALYGTAYTRNASGTDHY
jgi:hypothetical protein